MAIRLADAVISIGVDDSKLDSGLRQAEQRTSKWGSALQGIMAGVGIAVANAAIGAVSGAVAGIGEAIGMASDLSETVSKTKQLFGDSAGAILAWSETSATAFGQSKQQALDAAGTYAIFGRAAGLAGEDLVGFTTGLTELATDLSSFNNTSPEQAIEAIGAALRGESEPLRAYGVLLDDATLKASAFALGLTTDANATLTSQQKILAAQKAIFDQTSAQQGDFARTSDGLANSQKILAAQWDNLKTTFGSIFLPVMETATRVLNTFVETVLPPLKTVIETQVAPAIAGLASTFEAFATEHAQDLANWVANAVTKFGEFLTSLGALDDGTGTHTDSIIGRFVGMYDGIRDVFDNFNALFESNSENAWKYAEGFEGFFQVAEDLIAMADAVVEAMTLIKESVVAVMNGDWGAFDSIGQRWRDLGYSQGFPVDPSKVSAEVLAQEQARRAQGLAPAIQGEPNVTYTTHIPIVINAVGNGADIAAQANQGVQQALRQAGLQ